MEAAIVSPPSENPTISTDCQVQTLIPDQASISAKAVPSMGSPPLKNPSSSADSSSQNLTLDEPSLSADPKAPMGPPAPKFQPAVQPNSSPANDSEPSTEVSESSAVQAGTNLTHHQKNQSAGAPYSIPSWSEPPSHSFFLEVLKDGSIIDRLDV